jgi:carbamoyltransferase
VIHIVLDGYGDVSSGAIYAGSGSNLEEVSSFEKNASLGLVYSAVTEWAGFVPNEDEYKVMALAAFGKAEHEAFILNEVFGYTDDKLWVNEEFFNFMDLGLPTIKNKFSEKFGHLNDLMFNTNNVRDNVEICNVISSFQSALEKVVEKIISKALLMHPSTEAVLLGGGLFHNSRLVGILSRKFNKQIFVSPTPGDAGSSIGAAYFAGLCVGFDQINQLSPFCGPKTQNLDDFPLLFRKASKFQNDLDFAKQLLNSGKIFATYSGNCEVGPRALGNRSLCCDARSQKALEHLNEVIKQREGFRPIAPILEKKDFDKIFNTEGLSISSTAWMGQLVWPNESIDPAQYPFLHKDNSARVQVVDVEKTDNADHVPTVIRECLKQSYIIANTSFNIAGDPMVFDIEDCYINCIRLGVEFVLSNDHFYEVVK